MRHCTQAGIVQGERGVNLRGRWEDWRQRGIVWRGQRVAPRWRSVVSRRRATAQRGREAGSWERSAISRGRGIIFCRRDPVLRGRGIPSRGRGVVGGGKMEPVNRDWSPNLSLELSEWLKALGRVARVKGRTRVPWIDDCAIHAYLTLRGLQMPPVASPCCASVTEF